MARRTHTVFVGNLPFDVTEGEVAEMFSEAGPVRDMRIVTDKETGRPKGFGFCEFYDMDASETAVSRIDGQRMNGRILRVHYADDMPSRGGGRDRGAHAHLLHRTLWRGCSDALMLVLHAHTCVCQTTLNSSGASASALPHYLLCTML
uniref:RRM domain-containing protein n=1 Tax=Chlamydomonas euryale TaxID=1486919 RepID=A0A7R9Z5N5_9CHLO|mmetsp:Transcript_6680/g.20618  ORF Transcript_6680/g.20618 Transcript_6680/m.20618 type:complete len:148 (+) Transcript_6680:163-606(+)